jgi:hypothetical protein
VPLGARSAEPLWTDYSPASRTTRSAARSRTEVVSRVAEGNHWQWQLTEAETGREMELEMIHRIPRSALLHAYYKTLAEIGLMAALAER